ncbi:MULTISPECIES: hypothetical protein [unclassified Nocardia]|uniref:hypothetical protein n=1 Tax=unclassified Nocardia TaxID=2637762 RepID=UPI001CE45CC6|nr:MULTISPECIES: hypothetical protein [unclassified Nocardia]
MNTVTAQDATMFWLSRRIRNDQFLLYCFADAGAPTERLREFVARRVAGIPDLGVRLRELPWNLGYPSWARCDFTADQFVEHELAQPDWVHLSDVIGKLLGTGVDAAVRPWRLHIFRGVRGAPGFGDEPALVAVLQISHALADGRGAALIARSLFAAEPCGADKCEVGSCFVGSPGVGSSGAGSCDADRCEAGSCGTGTYEADKCEAGSCFVGSFGAGSCEAGSCEAGSSERVTAACSGDETAVPPDVRSGHDRGRGRSMACRVFRQIVALSSARFGAIDRKELRRWLIDVPPLSRMVTAGALGMRVVPAVLSIPPRMALTVVRGFGADRARRRLAELTDAGIVPPPAPSFDPSAVNFRDPSEVAGHRVRMIVCRADELRVPGSTVTVVVLTAISVALTRYLAGRGEPVERLGAQVPMALPSATLARNNYRSLGIDLHLSEPDLGARAELIANELVARRIRAQHPLLNAPERVTAAVPAPLLHRDVARYPVDTVPDSIAGHTVVSSVHRGPADLYFGGGAVRFTAGFPAIGSVMRLTHGVHGLGDTVTISLHADAALPDLDGYTELLRAALSEVRAMCLRH